MGVIERASCIDILGLGKGINSVVIIKECHIKQS
jgi:hypothetical protein